MEIVYRAKDGAIFETEARCREHESQIEVELFFSENSIATAPGFRTAIIRFKDYVKSVLGVLDAIEPIPPFLPARSEEKARERDHESAKEAIEKYFEEWDITDIEDLEKFFGYRHKALATYFGFHF